MAKKTEKTKVAATADQYDLIRTPVITEKASLGSQHSQVTFRVPLKATKPEIKAAVEAVFEVEVKGVNTSIQKGKMKRFKGRVGFRSDSKKAIITLKEGQMIDSGMGA